MSTFIQAYFQTDFFGKLIFLALFALSIATWVVLAHRFFLFRRVHREGLGFIQKVHAQKESMLQLSAKESHPYSQIYKNLKVKAVEVLDKNRFFAKSEGEVYLSSADIELLQSHLDATIIKQREMLEKNLYILSMTTALAPFIGLLGTVWGLMGTFSGLKTGGSIMSSSAVLGGLSTALTTTIIGLLIAIPALIGDKYLRNASRRMETNMDDFSQFLLSTLELQYRRVDA